MPLLLTPDDDTPKGPQNARKIKPKQEPEGGPKAKEGKASTMLKEKGKQCKNKRRKKEKTYKMKKNQKKQTNK
jgi:hypothetical protein